MRRLVIMLVALSLLHLQLHTSVSFAEESSKSKSDSATAEVNLAAEATYGALFLNCVDDSDMSGDSKILHAKSYDMFKVACANHIKDKINIEKQASDMEKKGNSDLSKDDGQYDSINAYASLAKSRAVVQQNAADSLAAASGNFDGILSQAKKELTAKEERVKEAEKWVKKAWMILVAGLAGLAASYYYMQEANATCQGMCFAPSDIACAGYYEGIQMECEAKTKSGEAEAKKAEGFAAEAMAFVKENAMMIIMAGSILWGVLADGDSVVPIKTKSDESKNSETFLAGIKVMLSSLVASFDKLVEKIELKASNSIETAFDLVFPIEKSLAVTCTNIAGCQAAGMKNTLSVAGLIVSAGVVLYGILDLLEAYEELAYAEVHSHLKCNGMGAASTTTSSKVPQNFKNNFNNFNQNEIENQFVKIENSKSEFEAFNAIRELNLIAKGNMVNKEISDKELISFDKWRAKGHSFVRYGTVVGKKVLDLVAGNDAYAVTATDLGYTGAYADQYTSAVSSAGTKQLEAWPTPETRVTYLEGLVATAKKAAAGGGGGAAAADEEEAEANKLLKDANNEMKIENGTDSNSPVTAESGTGGDDIKRETELKGCEATGTCANFSSTGVGIGGARTGLGVANAGSTKSKKAGPDRENNPRAKIDENNRGNLAMKDKLDDGKNAVKAPEQVLAPQGAGQLGNIGNANKTGAAAVAAKKGGGIGFSDMKLSGAPVGTPTENSLYDKDGSKLEFGNNGGGNDNNVFGKSAFYAARTSLAGSGSAGIATNDRDQVEGKMGGNQISDSDAHIFTLITQRYFKSAFPVLMDLNTESDEEQE